MLKREDFRCFEHFFRAFVLKREIFCCFEHFLSEKFAQIKKKQYLCRRNNKNVNHEGVINW